MIDYHGSSIALSALTTALAAAADPEVRGAHDRTLNAVASDEGSALLGSFVYHLLGHAASDGAETALLRRAADLWNRGTTLCGRLGTHRADLEYALEHPDAADAPDRFNAAAMGMQTFGNTLNLLRVDIDVLRTDVLKFPHLPAHPRQRDLRTDSWDWGNLSLGRRTDAFVRTLLRRADTPRAVAFATGAAAAYGGHVVGSAYLGHVVGGPRRTHRHRDRLARNAVGSWLAAHHPAARTPTQMASRIRLDAQGGLTLPVELEQLIQRALTDTFDLGRTQPLPDLQVGYQRLVAHLELLDAFVLPGPPEPPSQHWLSVLYADPQSPPASLRPQDVDVNAQDGGGVAVGTGDPTPGSNTSGSSDSNKTAKGCGIAFFLLIALDLAQAFVQCIGQWANKHTCTFWKNMLLSKLFEQDPPDPHDPNEPQNPGVTSQQLTAIGQVQDSTDMINILFELHTGLWEAMDRALVFLASSGLIYPTGRTALPLYAQFTAVPAQAAWPHREELDATGTYHLYPSAPIEHPTGTPSPFPAGTTPDHPLGQGGELFAAHVALSLWRQVALGQQDSQNLDLDADRGATHPCWAAQGSVRSDPVDVVVLGYDAQ